SESRVNTGEHPEAGRDVDRDSIFTKHPNRFGQRFEGLQIFAGISVNVAQSPQSESFVPFVSDFSGLGAALGEALARTVQFACLLINGTDCEQCVENRRVIIQRLESLYRLTVRAQRRLLVPPLAVICAHRYQ